jgi:hypothetical protein
MGPKLGVPARPLKEKRRSWNEKNMEGYDFVVTSDWIVWMAVFRANSTEKRQFESYAQQFADRFSAVE